MKAAILTEQHRPLTVADVTAPDRLRLGQVRVRVRYSGICGSQIGEIEGVKGPDPYLPHLLGHEGSGVVLDVGEGVETVRPGESVVLHWMRGAGHEGPPPVYRWGDRDVNAGYVTTFNEEAVVAENRVTAVPEDLDPVLAPLLGCAVTTGAGVVANDAGVRPGESVVVFGAGGVGLSIVQAAALSSAHPLVAVDVHASKLELARRLGATHAVEAGQDAEDKLRELLGPAGADVVVDTTGATAVIEQAYELAGSEGRVILVGVPRAGEKASIHTLPLHFGKRLRGSYGGGARPDRDIPRLIRLHDDGALDLSALVTDRFELDEINEAIEAMRDGRVAGRAIIAVAER